MFCRILKEAAAPRARSRDTQNHYEFQNYASLALAKHYIRFGGRVRNVQDTNYSDANFQGTYTYSNLNDYLADKPSQFSITTGTPTQKASVTDLGLYAEDDWKVRPNFTVSYGLRFETQNHIPNKINFAPRVALSYGIGGGGKPPKTVLRAGYGIFYNRFTYDLLLNTNRYSLNQQGQVQTIQSNPNGTPPDSDTEETAALPTFYRVQPGLNAPATIETGTGIEHQVNKSVSVSATYLYSRGIHQLLSRNIDAPLPDGTRPALGLCPSNPIGAAPGTPCNIYEYDSLAVFKENQIFLNLNVAYGQKLTFTGFYIYSKANSDTGGPGLPSVQSIRHHAGLWAAVFRRPQSCLCVCQLLGSLRVQDQSFSQRLFGCAFQYPVEPGRQWRFILQRSPGLRFLAFQSRQRGYNEVRKFRYQHHSPGRLEADPDQLWEWPGSIRDEHARGQELWRRPRVEEGKGAVAGGGGGGPGGGGRGMPGMGLGGTGGGPRGPNTEWIAATASL